MFKRFIINPFTAMLAAPSLGKRSTTRQTGNHYGFFPALHEDVKGFLAKCTVLKVDLSSDCHIHCLQACMRAIFSPEILQAGAVKGLMLYFWCIFYFSVLFFNTSMCVYLIVLTELLVCVND